MSKGRDRVGIHIVIIVNTIGLIGAKKIGLIFEERALRMVCIDADEPAQ